MLLHLGSTSARTECGAYAVGRAITGAVLLSFLVAPVRISAAEKTHAGAATNDAEKVETEDIFGFVEGATIGNAGESELEWDTVLRSGKSTGLFRNVASQIEYKYTALANFRISGVATFAYYDIAGVAGLIDKSHTAAQSLSIDARFRLLDGAKSPFGLTLSLQPHWGFADETSAVTLRHFGSEILLLADRELVPDRLIGALNVLYDTDRTRFLADRAIEQAPVVGIGTALAEQILPGKWLGIEARYLRSYEGASLQNLSGEAMYAGPTFYTRLGKQGWMSVAASLQAWGKAVGGLGALDLVNFERYQVKLRAGIEF
jgi:hypothetical protein